MKYFFTYLIILFFSSGVVHGQETLCGDGIDNDGDGYIDTWDSDCPGYAPFPSEENIAYQIIDNGSNAGDGFSLHKVDLNTGATTEIVALLDIGDSSYDIGLHPIDAFIYGIQGLGNPRFIIRIDAMGRVQDVGTVTDPPSATGSFDPTSAYRAAAFGLDGSFYVNNFSPHRRLNKIDLTNPLSPTYLQAPEVGRTQYPSGTRQGFGDISYNPDDDFLYGMIGNRLAKIDINTAIIDTVGGTITGPAVGTGVGAGSFAVVNATTALGRAANGDYYEIDLVTKVSTLSTAPGVVPPAGPGDRQDLASVFPLFTLPVELVNFEITSQDCSQVILSWETASETNNSHFVIERSVDGVEFESIGEITGQGTTVIPQSYSFTDNSILQNYFYRLRQVDFDGTFAFSDNILQTQLNCSRNVIYPNPVQSGNPINIQGENIELVEIFDTTGRLVSRGEFASSPFVSMSTTNLAKGVYVVRVNLKEAYQLVVTP